jgi:hypothetical protein
MGMVSFSADEPEPVAGSRPFSIRTIRLLAIMDKGRPSGPLYIAGRIIMFDLVDGLLTAN